MNNKLISGLVMFLIVLTGCNTKFVAECENPQFLGSEGITQNDEIDNAFKISEPILNSRYRYYDYQGDSILWRCFGDDEFIQDYKQLLDTACKLRGYNYSSFCEQCTIKNYPMCCKDNYCVGYLEAIEMGQGNGRVGGGAGAPINAS